MTKDEADAPAVVCDMTGAPDTGAERLAEYGRLFEAAFVARERTSPSGIRWVLRADPGIEAWAADLAARENACGNWECRVRRRAPTVGAERGR